MRKKFWKGLSGVMLCMTVLLLSAGCGSVAEERNTLGEVYDIESGDLFEVYLDGIAEGSIYFDTCGEDESEIRKTRKYGKEILTMELGQELSERGKSQELLFDAMLSYDKEEKGKMDQRLSISQYEDYIAVTQATGQEEKTYYYETNIDIQEAFSRLREMIHATKQEEFWEQEDMYLSKKPVVYLYPEKEMDIQVKLSGIDLTCTYPDYKDGWEVTAEPDGTIYTKDGTREYYCLYYEGKVNLPKERESGFIVEKEEYQSFLEEKLEILGLNEKEAQEFIIYWLPIMQEHDRLFVHFTEQEILDEKVPLRVTPKPDTLIRVFMQFSEVKKGQKVREQQLKRVERKGYSVIEWGGSFLIG